MKKLLNFVLFLTLCAISMPILTVGLSAVGQEPVLQTHEPLMTETVLVQNAPRRGYDEHDPALRWSGA